ncbi:MAG: hypothetical protein ACFE75_04560 [Candidatus Hodarchaeota archaeon]
MNQKIKLREEKEIDLIVINWRTFKDRIKFFDDIIAKLRLEGTPICIGIYTLGYLAQFWLIYLLGIFYVIGILCLDSLHFILLMAAVKQAKKIEEKFEKEILTVTKYLTTNWRTALHFIGVFILYATFIVVGAFLIYYSLLE